MPDLLPNSHPEQQLQAKGAPGAPLGLPVPRMSEAEL